HCVEQRNNLGLAPCDVQERDTPVQVMDALAQRDENILKVECQHSVASVVDCDGVEGWLGHGCSFQLEALAVASTARCGQELYHLKRHGYQMLNLRGYTICSLRLKASRGRASRRRRSGWPSGCARRGTRPV